ncbi:MAG: helix-turn-helix transcriptional regulator [Oscillospiraceae bacterium]|nr:helix-turn-helix transcriptional regulator [Oscillospiraceae bacterium]
MQAEYTLKQAEMAKKRRLRFKATLAGKLLTCGTTQKKLAEEIGISENSMSHKSNNYESFTVGEMIRIANRLGTSVGVLIGERNDII